MSRLLRVVFNADMRNSHDGLAKLAKSLNIDVNKLQPGNFVAFINSKKNHLKLYASGNIIAHLKLPNGKLNLNLLSKLPTYFNGTEIEYTKALREQMLKEIRE